MSPSSIIWSKTSYFKLGKQANFRKSLKWQYGILLYERFRYWIQLDTIGKMKGCVIPLRDKFKESTLGQIPLTRLLSLRSMCFKQVFLLLSKIMLQGWISMLLSSRVRNVELVCISLISLSYLVSWFLFFISGDDSDILSITDWVSLAKSYYNISLPSLQLQRQSSLKVYILTRLLGLMQFLLSLMHTNYLFYCSIKLIKGTHPSWKLKSFKFITYYSK